MGAQKEFDLELVGFRNFGNLCHDILDLIDQNNNSRHDRLNSDSKNKKKNNRFGGETLARTTSTTSSFSHGSVKTAYASPNTYINHLDDLYIQRPCQKNGDLFTVSKEEWEVITMYCALELRPLKK